MKKLLLMSFLFSAATAVAQTNSVTPNKNKTASVATVHLLDGRIIKGWFYQMDNDHVYLLNAGIKNPKHMNMNSGDAYNESIRIDAQQINIIAFKKKNGGLKSALIGLGAGVVTGAIIGLASGNDPVTPYTNTFDDLFIGINNAFTMTAGQKAVAAGLLGGLTGALTGAILGALIKKKFFIGGKKEVYHDQHSKLMQRLVL
ncbi:hypothetical protein QWZ08_26930 [Ferruginibacter paludis]|uniref:hypothetical protein n=1 Tax=Ferruginibacter paludis TaxID=1310417 RepID=UPI0025B2BD61|nr:hypothetical protein [Ferruginibacter paludis]MDN3659309.1 hypothetical protein [Ferruginibacter paludis]